MGVGADPAFRTEASAVPGLSAARVIHVHGRVTYRDAGRLRDSLLREVERTAARRVIVELSHVESLDTAGAAVLVEVLHAALQQGIKLVLCAPSESVLRMFRLAGFAEVLDYCCSGPDEARSLLVE
jgi:anti-anti-sigma factor